MEKRKIYINDTASNKIITLETDATTFGEVKSAVVQAGIDIKNKDWLEGFTKTSPTSDDSLLPTNIPYKGSVTNDLVFLLTNTNKKIKSGMTYKEMKDYIKNNHLAEKFKNKYKKNYTQGKTEEFEKFISNEKKCTANVCKKHTANDVDKKLMDLINSNKVIETENTDYKTMYENVVSSIAKMIHSFDSSVLEDINNKVEELKKEKPVSLNLSESDIKNIF